MQEISSEKNWWKKEGNCYGVSDPDIFFPDPEDYLTVAEIEKQNENIAGAMALCATCTVFITCRKKSKKERYGVWSGKLKGV